MKIKNIIAALCLACALVSGAAAQGRAEVKITDLTVKAAMKVTRNVPQIKTVIVNNDQKKAEKIKVTVYAMPAKQHRFYDSTTVFEFKQQVKKGAVSDFNLPLNFSIDSAQTAQLYIGSAWATSSKEIDIEPQSSIEVFLKLPAQYAVIPSGNADDDKFNNICKVFSSKVEFASGYTGVPPGLLTFGKSVFYIVVSHGLEKNLEDNVYLLK